MAVFRLRSEARFASPRACYLAAWVAQPRLEKDDCVAVHVASLLSWPGRPVACDSKDGSVLDFFLVDPRLGLRVARPQYLAVRVAQSKVDKDKVGAVL